MGDEKEPRGRRSECEPFRLWAGSWQLVTHAKSPRSDSTGVQYTTAHIQPKIALSDHTPHPHMLHTLYVSTFM